MCTSVMFFALTGLLAPGLTAGGPAWLSDYQAARQLGRMAHKPVAVVIGTGQAGWQKLSRDGRLSKEVERFLAGKYVCVYIDAREKIGRRLATAFDMPDGPGLVLSDRSGDLQAFRHEGHLDNEDLAGYLRRYADSERVVRATETAPAPRVSYYPSESRSVPPATFAPIRGPAPSFWVPAFGGGRSC